jgi:phosphatidylglycerophosphatase A
MIFFHKAIASGLGLGFIGRGGGSLAAGVTAVVWYYTHAAHHIFFACIALMLLTFLGIWSAGQMEKLWGHDSARVVVDEIVGMGVSLIWIPAGVKYVVAAFILFRFFDILKPFGIRKIEKIKGGAGVMLDDIAAGLYANVVLQGFIWMNWY